MSEQLLDQEIRVELKQTLEFAENIIAGKYGKKLPEEDAEDPTEVFMGPIIDLNDPTLNPIEIEFVESWIEQKLGAKPEQAPIKSRYLSADEQTTVAVFNTPLGLEENDRWYISCWQNKGEKPSYVFWPQPWYENLLEESGYQTI